MRIQAVINHNLRSFLAGRHFQQLTTLGEKSISEHTTHPTLSRMGYSSRRPHRVPLLSAKNRKLRLQFTQAHQIWTIEDWKNVAWSDESRFLLVEPVTREFDSSGRNWNKRLSLNLPIFQNTTVTENHCEDSYVPMASPPISCTDVTSDGYIPMSPSTLPVSLLTNGKPELPSPSNPDLEPPPVDRNLKPRRPRPPPLDLRGLSTISECPFHVPLTRAMTEPSTSLQCTPLDRRRVWCLNGSEQDGSITPTDSRQMLFPSCDSAPWMRPSQLDYLSLDFNSASPSPVQKKPLLADEYRVDYVKVDEKKTQALQSTKMEWKDVRQSKP
ncbi:GRB2-associated-binding protein 3 isoform X2 [Danio rerio]|uniref:GRB2-associated-binding protein 3 isoform X2 n=1 Tax=Danio rerio TaxID=7955 RepID=A0AC58JP00_DANRE